MPVPKRFAPPLLVGQSLELWRAPLRHAVRERAAAPLLACARRQLAAGAVALDLNAGGGDGDRDTAEALRWAVVTLRAAGITAPLWLDCGDTTVLTRAVTALGRAQAPLVVNAAPITAPPKSAAATTHALLAACGDAGVSVVYSPRAADAACGVDAIIEAHAQALTLVRVYGLGAGCMLDCLAYPPAHDAARMHRSLAWLRALCVHSVGAPPLAPLVAVGNVSHGFDAVLRAPLRHAYTAAALGAGARVLLAPVEDARLHDAVAVATATRPPHDATETWWLTLAQAARSGAPLPPPAAGDPAAHEQAVWTLLTQV